MNPAKHKKLGEMLTEAGMIDQSQLRAALSNQKSYGGRLGTVLVKMGFIKELAMLKFLSKQLGLPMVDLYKVEVDQKMIELIPCEVAEKYNVLPLAIKAVSGKPLLHVAMSDPTNLAAIDAIQFTAGHKINPVLALDSSLIDFINFYYKGRELPRQTIEMPITLRDEQLSAELQQTEPNNAEINTENLQQKKEQRKENLLPFIKALIALLVKKGVFTPEEFKETLTKEYKK